MTAWVTRNGDEIPIEEIETDHLANIIGMLRRNAEPMLLRRHLNTNNIERIYPIYTELVAELDRRLGKAPDDQEDDYIIPKLELE